MDDDIPVPDWTYYVEQDLRQAIIELDQQRQREEEVSTTTPNLVARSKRKRENTLKGSPKSSINPGDTYKRGQTCVCSFHFSLASLVRG